MNIIKKQIFLVLSLLIAARLKAQVFMPETYWQEVDFNDTTLLSSKVLQDKIIDFLYQYTCCEEKQFDSLTISGASILLEKAKVNMRSYEFVLSFLLNGYSNMGKSQIVDYLLTYPELFEGDISIDEGLRLDSITKPYQLVKVGAIGLDVEGVTINGETYRLYASEAEHIIIVFWSVDCEYCHEFLTNIRKHLNLKTGYELVTFAIADSQKEVEDEISKMRLRGKHFYDPLRWESKPFLDYHITSTPTVFLLDREKKIVCKPYDWDELKLYIIENK